MVKKNIISDFSGLKGKVLSPKVKPTPEPTVTDKGIRIGQNVVLMDSNLRGRIIGLGKNVVIELEDGLIIESTYGGFAITDKAEIVSLKEAKVKAKTTDTASRQTKPAVSPDRSLTIDLHIEAIPGGISIPKGQQLQFQMDTFRKIIRENLYHRGRHITFIHGIGDGILKAAIRKELDEVLALRCSYSVGDPAVTIVMIK